MNINKLNINDDMPASSSNRLRLRKRVVALCAAASLIVCGNFPEKVVSASSVCIIKFDAQGGTAEVSEIRTEYGKTITLPNATRDDYEFEGWYWEAPSSSLPVYTPLSAGEPYEVRDHITFYAHWF